MTGFGVCAVFLVKTSRITDRISINPINDPPGDTFVVDTQFMAPWTDRRHGSGIWHPKFLATLQLSQQEACLKSRGGRQWRRLDLAVKPDQRLVDGSHFKSVYVNIDILTTGHAPVARDMQRSWLAPNWLGQDHIVPWQLM